MALYHLEFKEYANIIQKKTLRDIISQRYSANEIQLGSLLSCCQTSNPKIKHWLLAVYRACKTSRMCLSQNKYLSTFKLKLLRIGQRLITELKNGEFNRVKLKKCSFIKKNSKVLPHDVQQLVSEISCFISETIDENSISLISSALANENSILKRKRFSRQLKDSLIKYCKDFNNYVDAQDTLYDPTNPVDELSEIKLSFAKFDDTLPSPDKIKKLLDMELLLIDQVSENDTNNPVTCQIPDYNDDDFNDFNIIEEWTEECDNEQVQLPVKDNFNTKIFEQFAIFITEMSDQIIGNIKQSVTTVDGKNFPDNHFHWSFTDNQSVSNLQQSYLADLKTRLSLVTTHKPSNRDSVSGSDCEDSLVRHKIICAKPRPSIKILSLKKPNCYIDDTNKSQENSTQFLQSIPLPNYKIEKERAEKSSLPTAEKQTSPIVNEEFYGRVEESIPESILDFSEVLVDEFECIDGKESVSEIDTSTRIVVNVSGDNGSIDSNLYEDRLMVIGTEEEDIVGRKEDDISCHGLVVNVDLNNNNNNNNEDICGSVTRSRTNYSVYSPDRHESGNYIEYYNYGDLEGEQEDGVVFDYHQRSYYASQNSFYYNGNGRYVERRNQRLFHNFLCYTTQSNEARPFFNHPYGHRNEENYRQHY